MENEFLTSLFFFSLGSLKRGGEKKGKKNGGRHASDIKENICVCLGKACKVSQSRQQFLLLQQIIFKNSTR